MTAPAAPMTEADALQHLRDALGANYDGPGDDSTLKRALQVDARGEQLRPWATAARLIKFNTEYEVGGELQARVDRKLAELEQTQKDTDAALARATGSTPGGFGGISWGDRP